MAYKFNQPTIDGQSIILRNVYAVNVTLLIVKHMKSIMKCTSKYSNMYFFFVFCFRSPPIQFPLIPIQYPLEYCL